MKHSFIKSIMIMGTVSMVLAGAIAAQSPTSSDIRDAVQKKVQEELANIKQAVAKRGFVGVITAKSETGITLTNLKKQSRTAMVSADATVRLDGGKDGTLTDLKVDDFVLAMGDVDSENKMTVKRLLVLKAPTTETRKIISGSITKVSTTAITVENNKKEAWTIKTSSTTAVSSVDEGKIVKGKLTDLEVGNKVVVLGATATGQNTLTGMIVHQTN